MGPLSAVLELVLPQRCAGCGAPRGPVCAACHAALSGAAVRCPPSPAPPGLPDPWAVAPYAGAVRRLIVAYKERGRTGLARPLGAALARAVRAAAEGGPILLVPVPSSRPSVRRRGHDPALRLAEAAVREIRRDGVAAWCLPVLRHRRRVADQAGLTSADRRANLAGALIARRDLPGVRVIVVDDVVTTGATLAEAARALRAAGARVAAVAVIAATARRGRPPPAPAGASAGRAATYGGGSARDPGTVRRARTAAGGRATRSEAAGRTASEQVVDHVAGRRARCRFCAVRVDRRGRNRVGDDCPWFFFGPPT